MPTGFGFPLGCALGTTALTVAIALGATAHPLYAIVTLAAVVSLVALLSTAGAALATATTCWALLDGFVLGRHGTLVFTAAAVRDALVLFAAALVVSALAAARSRRSGGAGVALPEVQARRALHVHDRSLVAQ
jgi:hypothetical protein